MAEKAAQVGLTDQQIHELAASHVAEVAGDLIVAGAVAR